MELRNKYIGFRISYSNYLRTIQAAQQAGVSITDFILSALLPKINDVESQRDTKYLSEPDYKFKINIEDSNSTKKLNGNNLEASKAVKELKGEDTSKMILDAAELRLRKVIKN